MKVIDLRCQSGHRFEGWFGSDDDFLDQNGRGLIECPLCADRVIVRLPSAPRLNLSGAREEAPAPAPAPDVPATLQARWLEMVRHVVANTEDVGERFADEARRIHYGETPERGIRGQASADEREALREEGIEVHPLPFPAAFKDNLQ
ncbi:MAG: DUF1178 family protein [Aquincola sp.]|nr:DUF1178 family protein [Aquincola sp.]MDH4290677.1 DUF1178 family protein [Aquincola sp.]MDH5328470.1 DUF1178 family protein [Aquincola sp.]